MAGLLSACSEPRPSDTSAPPTIGIVENSENLTVINRLSPKMEDRDQVVGLLIEGISQEMRPLNGFVGAAIHQSIHSPDIIVYAQWADRDALAAAAARVSAGQAPNMAQAYALGHPNYHPFTVKAVIQKASLNQ